MTGEVRIDDRMGISDLFADYAWAFDCGDVGAYCATFAPDGELMEGDRLLAKGRAQIAETIRVFIGFRGEASVQHFNANLRFLPSNGGCVVHSYYLVVVRDGEDPPALLDMGRYESHCVLSEGRWRFARRAFHRELPKRMPFDGEMS